MRRFRRLLSLAFIALLVGLSLPATATLEAADAAAASHYDCAATDHHALEPCNGSNCLTAPCCGGALGAPVVTTLRRHAPAPVDTTTLAYLSVPLPTPLRPPL